MSRIRQVGLGEVELSIHEPDVPGQLPAAIVLILPGGGYESVDTDREGRTAANWLVSRGASAAILRYRVAPHRFPASLDDAKTALSFLRSSAADTTWRHAPIAVWGFSAGAHLAGLLATELDDRPDLLVLAYPVVALGGPYGHRPSGDALLGPNASTDARESFSIEKRVHPGTPPTFIMHTDEDRHVTSVGSLRLYEALKTAGVPAELHIFQDGEHGVGVEPAGTREASWTELLASWLASHGVLPV